MFISDGQLAFNIQKEVKRIFPMVPWIYIIFIKII